MDLLCPAQPMYLTDFGTPGADLKGIYYLRNVVDADAIVAAIGEAKGKSNKVLLFTAVELRLCPTRSDILGIILSRLCLVDPLQEDILHTCIFTSSRPRCLHSKG